MSAGYQLARRRVDAGVFEQVADELRILVRALERRDQQTSEVLLDARTLQSTPESGCHDGATGRKGSKVHAAADTLGDLLAVAVIAAGEQERAHVAERARVPGGDRRRRGDRLRRPRETGAEKPSYCIRLVVVRHAGEMRRFVLPP